MVLLEFLYIPQHHMTPQHVGIKMQIVSVERDVDGFLLRNRLSALLNV